MNPEEMAQTLSKLTEALQTRRIFSYGPYDWQKDFHAVGVDNQERMLSAGNRTGKTYSGAAEVAFHLTGLYPDWWQGFRLKKPPLVWVGSQTNEQSRDVTQKELLGGLDEDWGHGAIPKFALGKYNTRQAGIGDVVDTVDVTWHHNNDESKPAKKKSKLQFKSYEQGWKKFQGTAPDFIWLDEEPDYKIFTECQTRMGTSRGRMIVTFTPLSGQTDLVLYFQQEHPGTQLFYAGWDDAPHLDREWCRQQLDRYPAHEREARSKGIPMLGEGRIYPVEEDSIKVDPFPIPAHFAQIVGVDFGTDHPAAAVNLAWDRDEDIIYVTAARKERNMDAEQHSQIIKGMGGNFADRTPVAWPHDGVNKEKGDNSALYKKYVSHGVTMLSRSARYSEDKGGGQPREPVIMEIYERMRTGRFKVFSNLGDWFSEFRNYHRKDGKVVDRMDDLMSATNYAVMDRRKAVPKMRRLRGSSSGPSKPILSTRL